MPNEPVRLQLASAASDGFKRLVSVQLIKAQPKGRHLVGVYLVDIEAEVG